MRLRLKKVSIIIMNIKNNSRGNMESHRANKKGPSVRVGVKDCLPEEVTFQLRFEG